MSPVGRRPEELEWTAAHRAAPDTRAILAGLPPVERQALVLAYFGGFTRADIGALLDLSDRAVVANLTAALTRLSDGPPRGETVPPT